ncbi:MAG: tetratricopeptide repeat protein, partial [Candidatus Atribacteria bacterium]|nr:tetratricopeptide repeat protein [Candidatus Atribacteria bacterium]
MVLVIIIVLAFLAVYVAGIDTVKSIPSEVYQLFHQAFSLIREQKYPEALEIYNAIINLLPHHPVAYAQRGNVYYYLGDIDKAIDDYSKAIELESDFAEAYNN